MARVRAKKLHRASFAYEARNLQGEVILQRVSSCTEKVGALLILEAMVDAVIKAKGLGYNFILSLSDSWRFVLVSNRKCRPVFGWYDLFQIGISWQFANCHPSNSLSTHANCN